METEQWLERTLARFAAQGGRHSNCVVLRDEDGDVHYVLWAADLMPDEESGARVYGDALVGYLAQYVAWEESPQERAARLLVLQAADQTEPPDARLEALEAALARLTATPRVDYCPMYRPRLHDESF